MRLRSAAAVVASLLVACGGSSTAVDAGADAAPDSGLVIAPPAPPVFTPCPAGWREVVDADSGLTLCDPWPEGGSASATCAPDEAHFPGTPGCARIGTDCAADGWPSDLPTDRTIVYVDDGATAGGTGASRSAPLATLSAGLAAARIGDVVALATGRYDETSLSVPSGVTIWGACVSGTQLTSTVAGDAPLLVFDADRSGVRNLAVDMPNRIALGVIGGGTSIEDVVVRGARISLFAMSGGVTAHHVAMREGRTEVDGSVGHAVDVGGSAQVVLDTVVIERNPEYGVWAGGIGCSVDARDLAILDIVPTPTSENTGRGLYADEGAHFQLARVVVERAAGSAVYLDGVGTTAEATDLVVRDVQPNAVRQLGRGIVVQDGAQAVLDRTVIDGARDTGLLVDGDGTDVAVHDGAILRMRSDLVSQRYGRGIQVATGAHLVLERMVVDRARESALFAGLEGTRVEISDGVFSHTLSSESLGDWGGGLWVQDGAQLTLTRGTIAGAHLTGVIAITHATVDLADVTIDDVDAPDCATTTCPDHSAAFGLTANFGGIVHAQRFSIARAAVCGVVVGPNEVGGGPSGMDLSTGEITDVAVGACVQVDGYDSARLRSDVAYRSVGVPLQATSYSLPDPL